MLTKKQQRALDVIEKYIAENGMSPTIDELCVLLEQKSKRGVTQYLEALEKKGYITRSDGHRSIKLNKVESSDMIVQVPILGHANAGQPLAIAQEERLGYLPISKTIVPKNYKDFYFLKVEGTSMNNFYLRGKSIQNGSFVLVDKSSTQLNAKDAFVFIVGGSATIKKFKRDRNYVYLLPDSQYSHHNPIILSEYDDVIVNGKVIDVFQF